MDSSSYTKSPTAFTKDYVLMKRGAPHAGILRPQLGGSAVVVQREEGHLQQLVRLPHAVPGAVVPGVELHRLAVRIYRQNFFCLI